jgi:hypothetical protein
MRLRYLANRNKALVAERVDTEVSYAPDARAMFAIRRDAIDDDEGVDDAQS